MEDDGVTSELLQDDRNSKNILPTKMPQVRVTFDEMLEELGEMGKFQITIYILVCFPVLFAAANSLSYLFVAGKTEYRCHVPVCDDFGNTTYDESWLPNALPSITKKHYTPAECELYQPFSNISEAYNGTCSADLFDHSSLIPCDQWIYKYGERTIMHDWKMFCKETWKLPFVGTMHFAGIVAGSAVFGFLADTFGRKLIFIFCILLMAISGVIQVICPDYDTFVIFIFINALGTSGVYPLAFIIGVELVGKKKRELTGMVLNYFYTIGEALVGVVSWFLKDWILIQLVISGPPLIFVFYWWLVPESVRWLLATKRTRQATNIIEKVAKTNGVVLSDVARRSLESEEAENEANKGKIDDEDGHKCWPCIKKMITSKKMVFRFLIILYIWLANVFTYYGLSVNSVNMSGNKYNNFILTCLAEIPGYTLAWILLHNFGRKYSLAGSLIACSLSSIAIVFIPHDLVWLQILIYLFSKMFVTSSLGIVYIHTAELMPTVIRSGGVGTASTISRLGAMVAPFVPFIYPSLEYFPMIIFSITAGVASIFSFFLPETMGKKLPETVEDAKNL